MKPDPSDAYLSNTTISHRTILQGVERWSVASWQVMSVIEDRETQLFAVFADRISDDSMKWKRRIEQADLIGVARARRRVYRRPLDSKVPSMEEVDPIDGTVVALFIKGGMFVVAQALEGYLGLCTGATSHFDFNNGDCLEYRADDEVIDEKEYAEANGDEWGEDDEEDEDDG
jgi:hypothetical protein